MNQIISKQIILDRIKVHYNFQSNAELARFLGIAPTTLSSWYSRNSIDYDLIFAKCEDINLEWLIRGKKEDMNLHPVNFKHPSLVGCEKKKIKAIAKAVFHELEKLIEES